MSHSSTLIVGYAVSLIVIAAAIYVTDQYFPILRDLAPGGGAQGPRSYSLGRVQMAWWSVILLGSLIYLLASGQFPVSGTVESIDTNLVILVGISGATAVVSSGIDANKDSQTQAAQDSLAIATDALKTSDLQEMQLRINAATDPESTVPAQSAMKLASERGQKAAEVRKNLSLILQQRRIPGSDGFLRDLLTDQNGNSLHRLQLIAFTVFYGAMVIARVAYNNSVSAVGLGEQELGLLGVSGGIYLGFKVPGRPA